MAGAGGGALKPTLSFFSAPSSFWYAAGAGLTSILYEIVVVLKQVDVNAQHPEGGYTALWIAAANGRLAAVKLLLAWGARPNAASPVKGPCALSAAAFEGHADVCDALIKAGADVNHAEANTLTPLYFACKRSHTNVVTLLLRASANRNIRSSKGVSWCVRVFTQAARDARAPLPTADSQRALPSLPIPPIPRPPSHSLMLAAEQGDNDVVKLLLSPPSSSMPSAAARSDYSSLAGMTAMYLAKARKRRCKDDDADLLWRYQEIIALLA